MPLDTASTFYDGTEISTPADLKSALLKRPEPLVREFTSKLMSYAIGRRIEYFDMPTVREIVQRAAANDYPMQSLIIGVILSDPCRMKDAMVPTEEIELVTR